MGLSWMALVVWRAWRNDVKANLTPERNMGPLDLALFKRRYQLSDLGVSMPEVCASPSSIRVPVTFVSSNIRWSIHPYLLFGRSKDVFLLRVTANQFANALLPPRTREGRSAASLAPWG